MFNENTCLDGCAVAYGYPNGHIVMRNAINLDVWGSFRCISEPIKAILYYSLGNMCVLGESGTVYDLNVEAYIVPLDVNDMMSTISLYIGREHKIFSKMKELRIIMPEIN